MIAHATPAALMRHAVLRAGVLAAAGVALGACAGQVEKQVGFEAKAHAAFAAKGSASIEGEGFLRRPNAWLARCSGGIVYLVPDTPYFREWVQIYRAGNSVENAETLHAGHKGAVRKTQCNMQGKFTFENLPAAKWMLLTRVTYEGAVWSSDQTLFTEVETKAGASTPVILSNPNRI